MTTQGTTRMCSKGETEFLLDLREKPPFDLLARPGRFPQKREAGLHAWVMEETADRDATPHLGPPMPLDQLVDDGFQRDPVQRIAGMGDGRSGMAIHRHSIYKDGPDRSTWLV